jgi:hypothetical protein
MKIIPLTQGYVASVDECDYVRISAYRWWAQVEPRGYVYAVTRMPENGRKLIKMHRFILSVSDGLFVDHRDGDGLHNCRINLRPCTRSENARNRRKQRRTASSDYKGATLAHGKWQAAIRDSKGVHYLGRFDSQEEAGRVYNIAAVTLHREFARLNECKLEG